MSGKHRPVKPRQAGQAALPPVRHRHEWEFFKFERTGNAIISHYRCWCDSTKTETEPVRSWK